MIPNKLECRTTICLVYWKAAAKSQTLWFHSCFIYIFFIRPEVPFYTRSFRRIHLSVFRYRLTAKNGFADPTKKFPGLSRNRPQTSFEIAFCFQSLFRPFHAPLVLSAWLKKKWSHDDKHFFGVDGQSLQHSVCKFLKSSKFEANLIHAMDFASFELFSVTYLGLHLVRKGETQPKTYKQTVIMNSSSRGRFFLNHVNEAISKDVWVVFLIKGAQSRHFELLWPCTKLPLNWRKPGNNLLN